MHAKALAPLLGNRISAAQKFPQLRLAAKEHRRVTHHRECQLPLQVFAAQSVEFATRELQPGCVVEIRKDDNRLIALGFFEPQLNRVDVFDLTPRTISMLPTISEDFFMARLQESWQRRRRVLHQTQNNTYRVTNGHVDGLPSLYVDTFSESFARVIATSAGAERLVPVVADFLRRHGAEELILDTPQLGGDGTRTRVVAPTIPMPSMYVEEGVLFLWLRSGMKYPTVENRMLLNPAHRRSRRMLRNLGNGKRVLCLNDCSGAAALNAVMTAKYVTVVEEDADVLEWTRANLMANHGDAAFKTCELVRSSVADLTMRRQCDVAYLEGNQATLCTAVQWGATLAALLQKKILGIGSIVMLSQSGAPLGIHDLLPRIMPSGEQADTSSTLRTLQGPVSRKDLAHLLRHVAGECGLRVRFLRALAASCDYPLLPREKAVCFTLVYLIEGVSLQ